MPATQVGTANPTHDAAGNMTKAADYDGTTTNIWDNVKYCLKEIDQSSSPNWKFDYDGLGRIFYYGSRQWLAPHW